MSTTANQRMPKESNSQKIGRYAKKSFSANSPTSWITKELDGDDDFGYDFQIQIETDGLVGDIFRLQLKGTTTPSKIDNDTRFSIPLRLSTVNYYGRATEPILLVLCDLSEDFENPIKCPLYYQWIHDEIRIINKKGTHEDQKHVTFHISVENRLLGSTNLTGDLDRFRRIAKVGEQLDEVAQEIRPLLSPVERSKFVAKIGPSLAQRSPALFDAIIEDAQTSWVEPKEGTLQWHLNKARNALQSGDTGATEIICIDAEKMLKWANPLEQADYWHIVGKLQIQLSNDAKAKEYFDNACKLTNDSPRHLIPWAEADIRLHYQYGKSNDFSATISRLNSSKPAVQSMKARLIAAEGRFDDALSIAKEIEGIDGVVARSIILGMQAKTDDAIRESTIGLNTPELPSGTKQMFKILRARSKFIKAIGGVPTTELPMSGPAGVDANMLHSTWEDISSLISEFRASGWPINVELISDIWVNTAAMLGLHKLALPVMAEAATTKPYISFLQAAVESLAAQTGDFALALECNARQEQDEDQILRRIGLLHLANKHKECIHLMNSNVDSININHIKFGFTCGLAVLSADKIVRHDLVKKWTSLLESHPQHAPYLALLQYFLTISHNILSRDSALAELEQKYESLNCPLEVALQLFHELDATDNSQAERCIAIAEKLKLNMSLDIERSLHLAQAYATLDRWKELLELSDHTSNRFQNSDRLVAIGALALDKLGQTNEAHERLQKLIEKSEPDSIALNTYIIISARSGFTEDALDCIERVLAQEKRPEKQLECLRHLFSLIHLSEPSNPRLIDIAWKMGELADPNNEVEEGLFLMSILTATLPADMPLELDKITIFQTRLDAFTLKFPESRILKLASFPDDATPDQLIRIMRNLAGMNDEQLKWRIKIQEELRRGVTPIPYSWRPRHFLDGIPDLPTLWEISKSSRWDDHQLHLTMASIANWEAVRPFEMSGKIPLLDLISLLVTFDLGITDLLFCYFGRIAICKYTLIELQQLISPISFTSYRNKLIGLQKYLKDNFNKIIQPGADLGEDRLTKTFSMSSEETANIARSSDSFILYSDDLLFRLYVDSTKNKSICTLDFLNALDSTGVISASQAAKYMSTLCSWRVGLVVTLRHQIAVIPDSLSLCNNTRDGVDALEADKYFSMMFRQLWSIDKPYDELQSQAAGFLFHLLSNNNNRIESIISVMSFWLNKARLHKDFPSTVYQAVAFLFISAIANDHKVNETFSRRLWTVFHALIEYYFADNMDDDNYNEAITVAGEIAAGTDYRLNLKDELSMYSKLTYGLTDRTSDSDRFKHSYTASSIQASTKNAKRTHTLKQN